MKPGSGRKSLNVPKAEDTFQTRAAITLVTLQDGLATRHTFSLKFIEARVRMLNFNPKK